jgi:glycosyltransferase involved in cell wall biosynthesis
VIGLSQLLRHHSVEVVHAHEFAMAVYGTAAARRLGLPVINTFHGAAWMTKAMRRRVALRWAIPRASASVAVSAATKEQLSHDLGIEGKHIQLVRNGVLVRSGTGAAIRREMGISDDELMILAVGNLEERKGHRILLSALQRLRENGFSCAWHLVIAGGRGGAMRSSLEAFAEEHGFADRLHILTYRDDIPDLQAAADIFAMPSLWEGLPLATLEAMLAGKAIVASDTAGIPEAISHEAQGLLVPPGDVDSLSDALARLMLNRDLRAKMGEAAKQRALSEFTIQVMTDRYEQLYFGQPSMTGSLFHHS